MSTAPILIVGCGDLGVRVGQRLVAKGERVTGLVRTEQSAALLAASGIDAQLLDLDAAPAPDAARVFWFAPPPNQGAQDSRLRIWLASLPSAARRIVYVSTSAVYGDCNGRWIAEDEPLKPQSDRGRRRLDAERALAEFAPSTGSESVVLRVPGIYGPGRLPIERLKQNLPVVRDSIDEAQRRWTNRIHIDDLATAAIAAMRLGRHGAAYNVTDGQPTTMSDYFLRCARLLGLPEPPLVSMDEARQRLSPSMMSFIEESKRLRNDRMLEELGVKLRYPDLATGLPACLPL
ncbi:MAG: SDR family oxidoreductase [Panacagrimonas sp.]